MQSACYEQNEWNINAKYNMLLENCHEMIFFFDNHGRILEYNQLVIQNLGYGKEVVDVTMDKLFPNLFTKENDMIMLFDHQRSIQVETSVYRKNFTCFPVEAKITYDPKANFGMCVALNISDKKKAIKDMEDAIENSENDRKMKNEFLANITHELRTPINGMQGLAESLLLTELDEEQQETIHIMNKCYKNMNKLIDDLLDFSRIEVGKLELEEREFDIRNFIGNIITIHRKLANEKELKFVYHISEEIPQYLIGDELRLNQILSNLLSNALKFTSIGHIALMINATIVDDEIELFCVVNDSGIGMDEAEQERLFQSFSQVDGSITRRFGGSGLGLAICKDLIQLMDGDITVNSVKGIGSTFSFDVKLKGGKTESTSGNTRTKDGRYHVLDTDYVDRIIKNINLNDMSNNYLNNIKTFGTKENIDKICTDIQNLIISIELGIWDKAENYAAIIKTLIPEDYSDIRKIVFKIELSARKEDKVKSLELIEELKKYINKVG